MNVSSPLKSNHVDEAFDCSPAIDALVYVQLDQATHLRLKSFRP